MSMNYLFGFFPEVSFLITNGASFAETNKKRNVMIKSELIKNASEKTGLSQKVMTQAMEAILCEISIAINDKKTVVLKDFGTFSVIETKEKMGYDMHRKEKITIPARERVKFKPHSKFRVYSMKG